MRFYFAFVGGKPLSGIHCKHRCVKVMMLRVGSGEQQESKERGPVQSGLGSSWNISSVSFKAIRGISQPSSLSDTGTWKNARV